MGLSRSRFPKVGDLDTPLELLEQHGWIRRMPEPERTGPGRRPSPSYEVHQPRHGNHVIHVMSHSVYSVVSVAPLGRAASDATCKLAALASGRPDTPARAPNASAWSSSAS